MTHGALAAVAAAAGALAGCGGGGGADAPGRAPERAPVHRSGGAAEAPSAEEQLRALVAARARALAAGDAGAYAATATGDRRRRDRQAGRRAARLGVREVRLTVESVRVAGRRARVRLDAAYEVDGVRSTYHAPRRIHAVRNGGAWRVRRVESERGLPPWEVAPFQRRRSPHFVLFAPPAVPAAEVLSALEAGYSDMRELVSRGSLRRRYLVVVADGAAQARALTTDIRGVETLAAIADSSVVEEGPTLQVTDVVSVRLLVNWEPFSALDSDSRVRVVTHELTHAALAGSSSGRTPAWLVEGIALYVSGDRRPAPPGTDLAALSRPGAIARLSGDAQAAAYAASSAAAFAIADRYGRAALLRLYDSFGDRALRGAAGRRLVDRALRRELGIPLADLEVSLGG